MPGLPLDEARRGMGGAGLPGVEGPAKEAGAARPAGPWPAGVEGPDPLGGRERGAGGAAVSAGVRGRCEGRCEG